MREARFPVEIREMAIESLIPAEYNPRTVLRSHDPAYRKLRKSLTEFGLVEPLVWNAVTGRVVGGHARLRILRELGAVTVPVSVVYLSETREKALNIVLNNHEAQGRFDRVKLAEILEELQTLPELELTGFDETTLASLTYEAAADPEPEAPATTVTVTLIMPPVIYSRLQPELDRLIRENDLQAHVNSSGMI